MAAIEPMKQFLVHEVVHIDPIAVPGLGMINMSITNSVLAMMVGALIIVALLGSAARGQLVPGRMQAIGEALYNLIDGTLVGPMIGDKGRSYIPFVFTIFMMVLVLNMMGLVFAIGNLGGQEWTFTATAQLAVTATLALIAFLGGGVGGGGGGGRGGGGRGRPGGGPGGGRPARA